MGKKRRAGGGWYPDSFKKQMVAESQAAGVTVPMVSKRHGVSTNRLYAWRQDARFQSEPPSVSNFSSVEVTDAPQLDDISQPQPEARIEITLENGRRLSVSDGVDPDFVLTLALGLAA
jgi:transposase